MLFRHFKDAEAECERLLAFEPQDPKSGKRIIMAHPAYDQTIKASHLFNLLDARGVISVTERQAYIGRVRALAKKCADAFRLTEAGMDAVNAGKLIVGAIVIVAAIAACGLWYTAERAYYTPVAFQPGAEIRLVPLTSDQPEAIIVDGIEGIDADSSPIKFRACFTTPLTLATLTETYRDYPGAEPLVAPSGLRLLRRRRHRGCSGKRRGAGLPLRAEHPPRRRPRGRRLC
jgi:hypothetical protein